MSTAIYPTQNPGQISTITDPPSNQDIDESEIAFDDFSNFSTAKVKIDKLISDFSTIIGSVKVNRDIRFKDLNLEALRSSGVIPKDAFMIPVRTVDTNIRREQPSFVNYLKQSKRLVIFKSITNPQFITSSIEEEFTRGMTYSGWDIPHFKVVDGSQTHGWDSVEVVFDITKPLHVGVEHIGTDRLIFPIDTINIQACSLLLRHFSVSPKELKGFISKYDFNPTQVKNIINGLADTEKGACLDIYKCFYKKDDIVYAGFYSAKASDWLKAPEPLFLGIYTTIESEPIVDPETGEIIIGEPQLVEAPISFYPIYILPYYETEQQKIVDHKGRVFLDKHKQEALTANISQFLNGCQRASRPIPSARGEITRNSELQSIELGPDKICPIPLDWEAPPYPESTMLQLQQYLETSNAQEAGQVNFAAQNRKDSRKTATEIAAAQNENAMLSSVQVSLYSNFIRQVYGLCWQIVKSQALQGKITFLPDFTTGQNNFEAIDQEFDIRSAGDVDVIKRQELIMQYKEFWPIIQTTPAAIPFLSRLVKLVFADEGDAFSKIIEQGDPRAVITQLVQILNDPQITNAILAAATGVPPEQRMILMQVLEQAKSIAETYVNEQMQKNPQMAEKIASQVGVNDNNAESINAEVSQDAGRKDENAK